MARLGLDYGDHVSGGKRTGAGVASGLGAFGYDVPAKDIDGALNANNGSNEKQRKAIYDTVVSRLGADQAMDRDAIMKAVDGALTLAGSKINLTRLMVDLKRHGATQGDLARIFEGRQSVRMLSLLKSDLEGILKDINEGVPGYGKKTFDIKNGLEKIVRELDAAWSSFSNTLVRAVLPEITAVFSSIAGWLKSLSQSSPATLKLGIGLTAAAGAARLSAMLIGFRMLTALGAGATLSALGGSLLALGRSILLFPIAALRGIGLAMWALVANPVGLIITGLVAALVVLGVWVANNWAGIKEFFSAFGSSFMAGIGGANGLLGTMVGHLSTAYNWLTQLLGPLDETGTWRSWGKAVGGAAASGVNAIVDAIQRLIGFFESAYNGAVRLGGAVKNMPGFGGAAPVAGGAAPLYHWPALAALGGPVSYGKPYLFGERGPELFTPGMSGRIETNDTLRRLTADGATAVGATESRTVTNGGPVTFSPTFNITGGRPPRSRRGDLE